MTTYRVRFSDTEELASFCEEFHIDFVPSDWADHYIESEAPLNELRQFCSVITEISPEEFNEKVDEIRRNLSTC